MKKRILALVLSLCMIFTMLPTFTLTASATECEHAIDLEYGICMTCKSFGYCGEVTAENPNGEGVTWTLDSDGLLTISGSGAMGSSDSYTLFTRSKIKKVVVKNGVTSLCDNAFNNFYNLTEATIEGDLVSVGEYAFWCTAEAGTTVYFNGNVESFEKIFYYGKGYNMTVYYNGTDVPTFSDDMYYYDRFTSDVLDIYVTPEYYIQSKYFYNEYVERPYVDVTVSTSGGGTAIVTSSLTSPAAKSEVGVKLQYYLLATPESGYYLKEYQVVSGDIEIDEYYMFTVGIEDIEINAVFEKIPDDASTITFDANGGQGAMHMMIVEAGSSTVLPPVNFTYKYNTFDCWNTAADGSGDSYSDKAEVSFTEDTILYAKWNPETYTVTYDANGGTGTMEPTIVMAGTSKNYTFPENGFTAPDGKMFVGWSRGQATLSKGSTPPYQPGDTMKLTSEYVMYAQWEEPAFEITIGDETTPTKYPNIRLAAMAVRNVEKAYIKVIRDVTTDNYQGSYPVFLAENLTFDLNNHTITVQPYSTASGYNVTIGSTSNVTIKGPGEIARNSTPLAINSNAVVTIEDDVVLSNTSTSGYVVSLAGGATLILNGGTLNMSNLSGNNSHISETGTTAKVVVNADNVASIYRCYNVYYNITPSTEPTAKYTSGKIWYKIDNKIDGATVTATEITTYDGNTYATAGTTLTVTPNTGVTLESCLVNGTSATTVGDGSYTFTMPVGVAEITEKKPHTHVYTYQVSTTTTENDTIKATCSAADCTNTGEQKITIAPPEDNVYTGSAIEARLVGSIDGVEPTVEYKATTGNLTENKPVNVGTYKASIKLGEGDNEKTAYVTYSITPKALTVKNATATDREYNGTNVVAITEVELEGVVGEDTAKVDTTNLTGTIASANASDTPYTSVTLPTLSLTNNDLGNYTLTQPTAAVETSVEISKLSFENLLALDLLKIKYYVNDNEQEQAPTSLEYGDEIGIKLTFDTSKGYALPDADGTLWKKGADDVDFVKVDDYAFDTLTGVVTAEKVIDYTPGDYKIKLTMNGATNYADISTDETTITVNAKSVTFKVTETEFTYESGQERKITFTPSVLEKEDFTVKYYLVDENNDKLYSTTAEISAITAGKYLYVIDFAAEQTGYEIKNKFEVTATTLPTETYTNCGYMYIKAAASSSSAQKPIYFEKQVVNATMTDTVENALTNPNSSKVTYESKNTDVATVDAATGAVTIKGTGSAVIIATSKKENSGDVYASYTLNVTKEVITITANDVTAPYGTEKSAISNGYTVSKSGVTLGGSATYTMNYDKGTSCGLYDIEVSGLTSDIYEIVFEKGTLTVTPKEISLTDLTINADDKEYDTSIKAVVTASVKDTALVTGDIVNVLVEGTFASADASDNEKTVSYTVTGLSGTHSSNYKLTGTLTGEETAKITKAPVTVSVPAKTTYVYDGENKSVNVIAYANGIYFDKFNVTYTKDNEAATPNGVGTYAVGVEITDSNYVLSGTVSAEIIIKEAQQDFFSIEGISDTVTYGDPAFNLQADGVETGATVKFAVKSGNAATVSETGKVTITGVGSVTVEATSTLANHTTKTTTRTFTVKPKTLNVTAAPEDADKVYDGTKAVSVKLTLDGVVGEDKVEANYKAATMVSADVEANKTVFVNGITLSGDNKDLYQLSTTSVQTSVNVTQKEIKGITFTAEDKVYNGNAKAEYTVTALDGVVSGEEDFVTVVGTAYFADEKAGTDKTVTLANPVLSGSKSGNYKLNITDDITAKADIEKATVDFTLNKSSKNGQ